METDILLVKCKAIEDTAIKENLVIFKAADLSSLWAYNSETMSREAGILIDWSTEEGWQKFIEAAKAMKVSVVYIDTRKFSWQELMERINGIAALNPDELSKRKKQAEAFKRYDGFVEHLIFAFRADGIWHAFQETADWLPKYLDLEAEPEELEEEEEEHVL